MKLIAILFSGFLLAMLSSFTDGIEDSSVKDIDGNAYKTVRIGNQVWMAENLKVGRYRDGEPIAMVKENESWKNTEEGASCYYANDSANGNAYGGLYNWFAITSPHGLCPYGWHIPSNDEWSILIDTLEGMQQAGGKMKALKLWATPNEGATNASGFAALPAGMRYFTGNFMNIGSFSGIWSSTEGNPDFGNVMYLDKGNTKAVIQFYGKKNGFSCRCVKD